MSLDSRQKKFIKKNVGKLSLKELAVRLDISQGSIQAYLKEAWDDKRYEKFLDDSDLGGHGAEAFDAKPKGLAISRGLAALIKDNWLILLFLAGLAFLVYINGLNNAFVSDDIAWIPQNKQLGDINFLLALPDRIATWVVFFISYAVGGLNPIFFRFPNILAHIGSVLAAYLILVILGNKRLALITASLFAVHPILSEAITWIAGGSHAQYAFFFLLSFLFYLYGKTDKKYYWASLFFFIVSFLFSEKAVVLSLIFVFYEIAFGNLVRSYKIILPYFLSSVVFGFIQFAKIGQRVSGLATYNYLEPGVDNPLIQVPVAISEYLKLIFFPRDLTLYHSEMSFTIEQYIIRLIIFLIFLGVIGLSFWQTTSGLHALWQAKKGRWGAGFLFFWLSLFVVSLLPTLTPFRVSWIVAERYAYLGTLGILAAVGLILERLSRKGYLEQAISIMVVVILLLLGYRTILRNIDWKNEDNLWIATAKTSPSSPNTHNNLGDVYGRWGDLEKSAAEFQKAIDLKPNYADAYHNLANTQQKLFEATKNEDFIKKAIENYQLAIKYNPSLWQSHQNLGVIYLNEGKRDLAREQFLAVLKINPDNLNVLSLLKEAD